MNSGIFRAYKRRVYEGLASWCRRHGDPGGNVFLWGLKMTRSKWLFLSWIVFISAACLPLFLHLSSSRAEEVLSLEDAIGFALKNNRNIRNAAAEIEKADAAIAALRTRRYPNLNLRYTGAQQLSALDFEFKRGSLGSLSTGELIPPMDTKISTPKQWENQGQALVAQPLAQLYRLSLEIDRYGLVKNIAEEQYRHARSAVINDVRKAYLGILETQSAFQALKEAIGFYVELERLLNDHLREQTILKADLLEVKSKLAQARYEATRTENALSSQKEQLNHLLGRDLSVPFAVSEAAAPPPPEMDTAEAIKKALEQRAEIREAKLKARQAEYGIKIKRSEYIPDVDLVFSYTRLPEMEIMPKDYAYAGVRLTWEPFDWGRKQQELLETKKTVSQANTAIQEAESMVRMEVTQSYRKMREAYEYLEVAKIKREAAQERLRVTLDRYNNKATLLKDLLQSQAQAAEANHQLHQALLGCLAAKSDFQKAMGGEER